MEEIILSSSEEITAILTNLVKQCKKRNLEKRNRIIGDNLKKHRKNQHLTQEQLGKMIGRTTSSIQKYESGKTEIPRSVLEDIAAALDLHLLDILLDPTDALEWYDARDDAIISLLYSLGCRVDIEIDTGKSLLHYKGHDYIISTSDLLSDLFSDIEDDTEHLLKKFIKKHV